MTTHSSILAVCVCGRGVFSVNIYTYSTQIHTSFPLMWCLLVAFSTPQKTALFIQEWFFLNIFSSKHFCDFIVFSLPQFIFQQWFFFLWSTQRTFINKQDTCPYLVALQFVESHLPEFSLITKRAKEFWKLKFTFLKAPKLGEATMSYQQTDKIIFPQCFYLSMLQIGPQFISTKKKNLFFAFQVDYF